MHAIIFFINIGFYHAARIRAAYNELHRRGGKLTAVQLTNNPLAHPWGNVDCEITFPLLTLVPQTGVDTGTTMLPDITKNTLEDRLAHVKPDVAFLPGWAFPLSIAAIRWCKAKHIPTVVMSDSKYDDKQRKWWREKIKSMFIVRKFDAALVGGKAQADYIASLGLPRDRIFTGYDVVDNDHFHYHADLARSNSDTVRAKQKIPKRPYFLSVTRLVPRKNIKRLIDAYARYRKETLTVPWDLVICGDGEQKKLLEKLVHDLGLNSTVHFPGFISYQDIGYWYGLAGAFIHPALNEQWGLVVNEACATGLPILCSETVGARYDLVQKDKNGFLFDPESRESIKRCLLRMQEIGPEKQQSMGIMSRQIVKLHSPESFAAGFISAASKVL